MIHLTVQERTPPSAFSSVDSPALQFLRVIGSIVSDGRPPYMRNVELRSTQKHGPNRPTPKERKNAAHGASRGSERNKTHTSPGGAKENSGSTTYLAAVVWPIQAFLWLEWGSSRLSTQIAISEYCFSPKYKAPSGP